MDCIPQAPNTASPDTSGNINSEPRRNRIQVSPQLAEAQTHSERRLFPMDSCGCREWAVQTERPTSQILCYLHCLWTQPALVMYAYCIVMHSNGITCDVTVWLDDTFTVEGNSVGRQDGPSVQQSCSKSLRSCSMESQPWRMAAASDTWLSDPQGIFGQGKVKSC